MSRFLSSMSVVFVVLALRETACASLPLSPLGNVAPDAQGRRLLGAIDPVMLGPGLYLLECPHSVSGMYRGSGQTGFIRAVFCTQLGGCVNAFISGDNPQGDLPYFDYLSERKTFAMNNGASFFLSKTVSRGNQLNDRAMIAEATYDGQKYNCTKISWTGLNSLANGDQRTFDFRCKGLLMCSQRMSTEYYVVDSVTGSFVLNATWDRRCPPEQEGGCHEVRYNGVTQEVYWSETMMRGESRKCGGLTCSSQATSFTFDSSVVNDTSYAGTKVSNGKMKCTGSIEGNYRSEVFGERLLSLLSSTLSEVTTVFNADISFAATTFTNICNNCQGKVQMWLAPTSVHVVGMDYLNPVGSEAQLGHVSYSLTCDKVRPEKINCPDWLQLAGTAAGFIPVVGGALSAIVSMVCTVIGSGGNGGANLVAGDTFSLQTYDGRNPGLTVVPCGTTNSVSISGQCYCQLPLLFTAGKACCARGSTWNDNTKQCSSGSTGNTGAQGNTVVPCGTPNADWDGKSCICRAPNAFVNSKACCSPGGMWDDGQRKCVCEPGKTWNDAQKACVAGGTVSNTVVPCGTPNADWDGTNCICRSPNSYVNNKACCSPGGMWDSNQNKCVCAPGKAWNDAQKACI